MRFELSTFCVRPEGLRFEHERFDTLVVPARTSSSDGFQPTAVAWLLENAPRAVLIHRSEPGRVPLASWAPRPPRAERVRLDHPHTSHQNVCELACGSIEAGI